MSTATSIYGKKLARNTHVTTYSNTRPQIGQMYEITDNRGKVINVAMVTYVTESNQPGRRYMIESVIRA